MSLYNRSDLQTLSEQVQRSAVKSAPEILQKSFLNFSETKTYDIFLSHSYRDAPLILGLKQDIESMGFSVYVDWVADAQLDRTKVTKATASLLKIRMRSCKSLLFAHSINSQDSIWMPWELGYFDGIKNGMVAVIPIAEVPTNDVYQGHEYLGLYYYVTKSPNTNHEQTLWVHDNKSSYIDLKNWLLTGKQPYVRS